MTRSWKANPAISERVRKLEDAGVITGYGAHLDPRTLGLRLQAIVRLRTTHINIQRCIELFESLPEVIEAFRVTGEDCFIVRCLIAEPEELERLVDSLAAYGTVQTSLVLSNPVSKDIPIR
jgi:Lrp/AsnC family transcriptional regulator, leucine-responsive regulatory protein